MSSIQEPIHPLFLPEDDDDAPQVSEIQICRMENGQQVFAPRVRPASELQSLEQIVGEFGGGTYILIARYDGRISTRRKVVLPGLPKPMYDEGPKAETTIPVSTPVIDPMMAMMGGQGGGMMPFFMMMMQQQDKVADRQMQMMIAMMQGGRESSAEERANARAEMQANIERERIAADKQMAMMREMMMLMQTGKSGSDEFTKGVEFMRSFATQQVEMAKVAAGDGNSELGSLLETLGQAFQAAQAVGMFKGAPLPEGAAQAAAAVAENSS